MKLNGKILLTGVLFMMARPLFAQNVFLEINLNNQTMQYMFQSVRAKTSLNLFRVIERAGNDKKIKGIVLNISSYNGGQDSLWELRNALEKFKAKGKKVCVFISNADLDTYSLATVADKIVMDELGVLTLLGYSWGRGYVQHSLEKLGVGVQELRYFEFKSAAETYTRDSLSAADRKQYGQILDEIMALTRDTITRARGWTAEEFDSIINKEFMFSAKSAHDRGIVDYKGRQDAVLEAVKEMSGGREADSFYLYGDSKSSVTGSKFPYGSGRQGRSFESRPVIAVINANGITDMEQGIAAWSLAQIIRELAEKHQVKAIVLRINSPGGSAEAADHVAEAIKAAKERVPVVVSMGSVAASGGYWASMTSSHIVASPVTMTGSIGVIGSWFYDNGLNSKLGFSVDTMQRGDHADMVTGMIIPKRSLNPAEKERYRDYMMDLYADFTARVAKNRNMDIEKVEALAQGRVYSGIGAINAGLIDSIGGLDDAIQVARKLADISEDRVVTYTEFPKPKFFDRMFDRYIIRKGAAAQQAAHSAAQKAAALSFAADLAIPPQLLDDLRYRISHNGQVMPILPLDSQYGAAADSGW